MYEKGDTVKIKSKSGHEAVVMRSSADAWKDAGWDVVEDDKPVKRSEDGTDQPNLEQLEAGLGKPEKK